MQGLSNCTITVWLKPLPLGPYMIAITGYIRWIIIMETYSKYIFDSLSWLLLEVCPLLDVWPFKPFCSNTFFLIHGLLSARACYIAPFPVSPSTRYRCHHPPVYRTSRL
jgi:hypothetical protein